MADPPDRPPEAWLLLRKRTARKLSPAQAAQVAGVSVSTYRQVENGYHVVARGVALPKTAPPETLAQMLRGFGATPRELIDAGRADAAEILEGILAEEAAAREHAPPPQEAARRVAGEDETARARAAAAGILRRFGELPPGVPPDQAGKALFSDSRLAAAWDAAWTAIPPDPAADPGETAGQVAWAVAVTQVRIEAGERGSRQA